MSVSVVIPVYNASRFVIETLESVLRQTYADWELILVDDGSTDDSVERIEEFIRARPAPARLLRHPHGENRGTSATRNLGLLHATGDLVCFLDADDVWKPGFLAYFVDKFASYPDLAMAYGPFIYWDPAARDSQGPDAFPRQDLRVGKTGVIASQTLFTLFLEDEEAVPTPSAVMMRRDRVVGVGGWEAGFRGMYDDQVLYAKLLLPGGTAFLADESLCLYRQHEASLCRTAVRENKLYESRKRYLAWLSRYLRETPGAAEKHLKTVNEQVTLLEVRQQIDLQFGSGTGRLHAIGGIFGKVVDLRQAGNFVVSYKSIRYGLGYFLAKLISAGK